MKIKDLLKITGISLLGVLGVGLSIFGSAKGMTLLADNYNQVSAYYVDDLRDSVTFTKEELNNCSYPNLTYALQSEYGLGGSYIVYNGLTLDYNDSDDTMIQYFIEENNISYYISFLYSDYQFSYLVDETQTEFEYPLTIYCAFFAENMQKSITLSASQLNNNTYEYLNNYVNTEGVIDNQMGYVIYNNKILKWNSSQSRYDNSDSEDNLRLSLPDDVTYKWRFTDDENNELQFTNSVTFYSTYIADNLYAPNQPVNLLTAIVGLLTGGITGIASGVGSGVSTLTTQIFISNNALSVFGGMIVVFAGVSLAIALCRWVMQLLTSLCAKK